MSDIAFKVIIKNDGIDDVIFKTLMLKGEKGDKGDAGGAEIDDSTLAYNTTWSSNKINDEISSMPDNLSELDDVALANITDGQMLAYDIANHRWKNKTADASSLNYEGNTSIKDKIDEKANTADLAEVATGGQLIDLSDVDVSSPSANDALVWDAEHGKWIAGSVSTVGSIDDLTDVDTSNASAGDCLRYDASNSEWIAQKQVIELTQAEYDALTTKQPNTLYVITDGWNLNATANDLSFDGGTTTTKEKIDEKANSSDVYTKAQTDTLLDSKTNKSLCQEGTFTSGTPFTVWGVGNYSTLIVIGMAQGVGSIALVVKVVNNVHTVYDMLTGSAFSSANLSFAYNSTNKYLNIISNQSSTSRITVIKGGLT